MEAPVSQEYAFDPAATMDNTSGQRDIMRELKNIEKFTVKPCADREIQIQKGMFAGKIITHDLVTKQWNEKTYSYNAS